MRVLVIEDEYKIANSIKKGLEQEGYAVDAVYDGTKGYDLSQTEDYDAIILDLMLPGMDGIEITGKLREEKIYTPILMLTAKGEVRDRVTGLNSGADDYLVKPFAFEELLARIKALIRRPKKGSGTVLRVGNLELNTTTYDVRRSDTVINLSKKEFSLLEYMMRNAGKVLNKDQIMSHVWDYDSDILPNTVEVYVGYLRQKIDKAFPREKILIHTLRGFGYKITTDTK